MQVLIVGGCGFLGYHLSRRFIKEGHETIVIDDLSSGRSVYDAVKKENFYQLSVEEGRCEEVFRTHNIQLVIWALPMESAGKAAGNLSGGLLRLLGLAKRYQVEKFLYVSLDSFCRKADDPLSFTEFAAEACCLKWKQLYQGDLTVVRLPVLYGPGQEWSAIGLPGILEQIAGGDESVLLGAEKSRLDLLYVDDAVDAIYRLSQRFYAFDVLEVSGGELTSMQEIGEALRQIAGCCVQYGEEPEEKLCPRENSRQCERELGWKKKYSVPEGMEKTLAWHRKKQRENDTAQRRSKNFLQWKAFRPYIENIALFSVCVALMLSRPYHSIVNVEIGLDYNFIYIATMGLLYGKSQSIPAVILSSVLLLYSFAAQGADLVAIIYQAQHMVHLAAYLFFGVIVGYVTDNKERAYSDLETQNRRIRERYGFLERMYLQNNAIKERLYRQIVNADDSLGQLYKILQQLESVEVEKIFTAANDVMAEVLGVRNAAIYVFARNRFYLRLKTQMGEVSGSLPNSLKIDDHEYLKTILEEKQVFVNRMLVPGLPDMAAPIIFGDEIIAVLQVYRLKFEDLSLYNQNRLKITSLLISNALAKAYRYEKGLQDQRYLEGTQILKNEEFMKIKNELQMRTQRFQKNGAVLFRITERKELHEISQRLMALVRSEDYVGIGEDGGIQILLTQMDDKAVETVRQRFKKADIQAELEEGRA